MLGKHIGLTVIVGMALASLIWKLHAAVWTPVQTFGLVLCVAGVHPLDHCTIPAWGFIRGDRAGQTTGHTGTLFENSQSDLHFRLMRHCRRFSADWAPDAAVDLCIRDPHADLAGGKGSYCARGKIWR